MGSFSGMASATRGFASNRLIEGDYIVRIDKAENFEARQTGEKYKITATILAVTAGRHKEGEVVTVMYSKNHGLDQYLSNIKSFIAGVLNLPDPEVDEKMVLRTLDPEQAMSGLVTRVRAIERDSKKKDDKTGTPFQYSVYTWAPFLQPEEIATAIGAERVKRFFPSGL